jgi:hypothetical protein
MKGFAEFLDEHVVNVWSDAEKTKHLPHVWNMMQQSYIKAGGFHSAESPADLMSKSKLWKLHRKHGEITAAVIYKDLHGRKAIAAGTNGTFAGKEGLLHIKAEDIRKHRAWGEFSGAMEHIMLKQGAKYIPHKHAEHLTGKPILHKHDDGIHYDRIIGGERHTKALMGYPNQEVWK